MNSSLDKGYGGKVFPQEGGWLAGAEFPKGGAWGAKSPKTGGLGLA